MTSASKIGRIGLAILFAGALSALAGCSSEPEGQAVAGSAKAAKLSHCVRPTSFMRRNHMELIKHQRTVTVHQGVRDTPDTLAGCIDCHVQRDAQGHAVPINGEGQFCDRCHDRLAVRLDCFECHSPVPNGAQPASVAKLEAADGTGHPAVAAGNASPAVPMASQERGN